MGEFAETVQNYLRDQLGDIQPTANWETEYNIAGTPVDVAGLSESELVLIELEWRRADPADNTAKLFRHLDSGEIESDRVSVFQVFTEYYELARGGVSSKRKNAEFVGDVAAESTPRLLYYPVEFGIDPPKRGEEWPEDWKTAADSVVRDISSVE